MTQLDGVYVILVTAPKPVGESKLFPFGIRRGNLRADLLIAGVLPTILGGPGGAMEVKTEEVVPSGVEIKGGMKKRGMAKRFLRNYD